MTRAAASVAVTRGVGDQRMTGGREHDAAGAGIARVALAAHDAALFKRQYRSRHAGGGHFEIVR